MMPSAWAFETELPDEWAYWENAFTAEECEKIIGYSAQSELEKAQISDATKLDKVRSSYIKWITPDSETDWVYRRLTDIVIALNRDYFKFDLFGFGEPLQLTKYISPNGKYTAHVDKIPNGPIRKLTVVVQLSDDNDYEGGELHIITSEDPNKTPKKRGTVIVFPSYTLHEVTEVTKGTRFSLVGWVTGSRFK